MFQESTIRERFDLVIPGSEIPDWFMYQSEGDSIYLEVPAYLFKQFRGIAFCAVFQPRHWDCPPEDPSSTPSLLCPFEVNGYDSIPCISLSKEIYLIESDHRWFIYLHPNFFQKEFGKEFFQIADGSSCQLWFRFKNGIIKKCGAHIIYEEEMEDLKESMGQSECSSSTIPYNEGVDHFEVDIKSKRSRDDEIGASGEGSSTHTPHPKTKRSRRDGFSFARFIASL